MKRDWNNFFTLAETARAQLAEAVGVIEFCRNANPHPDLSYHKYNDAYRLIEEKCQAFLAKTKEKK